MHIVNFQFSARIRHALKTENLSARWHHGQAFAHEILGASAHHDIGARASLSYAINRHAESFSFFAPLTCKAICFRGFVIPRAYFERTFTELRKG